MKLVIKLKNGSRIKTELSDKILLAKNGQPLTSEQLGKKMAITARATAGVEYKKHTFVM